MNEWMNMWFVKQFVEISKTKNIGVVVTGSNHYATVWYDAGGGRDDGETCQKHNTMRPTATCQWPT